MDGGSSDKTRETVTHWADRGTRLIESQPGRGHQLRLGAEAARGETLVFLHADTWLDPEAGTAISRAMADPSVVGGCFNLAIRGPTAQRWISRVLTRAINARTKTFRTATGDQGIFCRRDAYARSGGFTVDELFEDVIFYRSLRRSGKVVVLEPPVHTSDRRWRANGYLRTIATHLGLRLLFLLGVAPKRLARIYRKRSGVNTRSY